MDFWREALEQLDSVKKSAAHFGMAFQIADDLGDMKQDLANHHPLNLANACGKEMALQMFHEELDQFNQTMVSLKLDQGNLPYLAHLLLLKTQHTLRS